MKNNTQLNLKDLSTARRPMKIVGVIGGNRVDTPIKSIAKELGKRIAQNGYVLVCGGLGGVMEAACMGASIRGGITVGILPGNYRGSANPFVMIPITTAMSHARNAIIVRTADILVAIDGKYGTLSEIALAKAIGKRVLGLYTWDEVPGIEPMESVDEVMEAIKEFYGDGAPL